CREGRFASSSGRAEAPVERGHLGGSLRSRLARAARCQEDARAPSARTYSAGHGPVQSCTRLPPSDPALQSPEDEGEEAIEKGAVAEPAPLDLHAVFQVLLEEAREHLVEGAVLHEGVDF